MRLKLDLDAETASRLRDVAFRELRSVDSEAVVLLRTALGLPVPFPAVANPEDRAVHDVVGV